MSSTEEYFLSGHGDLTFFPDFSIITLSIIEEPKRRPAGIVVLGTYLSCHRYLYSSLSVSLLWAYYLKSINCDDNEMGAASGLQKIVWMPYALEHSNKRQSYYPDILHL